jgi:hypothetical protein
MGYTHYWERRPVLPAKKFKAAAEDCRRVYELLRRFPGGKVQWEYDEFLPPAFGGSLIRFNGVGEDAGETFLLNRLAEREGWQRSRPGNFVGGFCKTGRAPYDKLVCACLIVLKHHLGDDFRVSSDGDDNEENWPAAREVCQEVLGYGRDFSLRAPDRLSPQGLWFSTPTNHPEYGRLWELENGWWVQATTTVTYVHDASWPHSGIADLLRLGRCGIKEAAWEATKLYLRRLVEPGIDRDGLALLEGAMKAKRGDWQPWHVLADQQEDCGRLLLRDVLPRGR